MDGARAPLSADTLTLLRRAVVAHATAERRHQYPPTLHLGVPGEEPVHLCLDGVRTDPGLRTDVVAALRARAGARPGHLVWLTRPGALDLQDVDRDWLLAARSAYDEAGLGAPLFVVVNRRGWRDPRSGLSRTWARIRPPRPEA